MRISELGSRLLLIAWSLVFAMSMAGCTDMPSTGIDPSESNSDGSEQAGADSGRTDVGGSMSSIEPASTPSTATDLPSSMDTGAVVKPETQPPLPPTAYAGPDQTVEDGDVVMLAGSGIDPSGSALTYDWLQTAGIPITLSNASAARTTFTAPAVSGDLRFALTARSPSGSGGAVTNVHVVAAPLLFVAVGESVVSFRKPQSLKGNVAPRTKLAGTQTLLEGATSVVLDKAGNLIVANASKNRLTGFLEGAGATGDISPNRFVNNPGAMLSDPEGLAYDKATDLLFVSNFNEFPWGINVYADASLPTFTGPVAPTRQFKSVGIRNPRAIQLAPNGDLYVANAGNQNITVFEGASGLTDNVAPSRTIDSPGFKSSNIRDLFVDGKDTLYVVDGANQRIFVFGRAAALRDGVVPTAVLSVPGAQGLAGVVVDRDGTGYITDSVAGAVYVYANLAGRDGLIPPDGSIQGPATELTGAWHMLLLER